MVSRKPERCYSTSTIQTQNSLFTRLPLGWVHGCFVRSTSATISTFHNMYGHRFTRMMNFHFMFSSDWSISFFIANSVQWNTSDCLECVRKQWNHLGFPLLHCSGAEAQFRMFLSDKTSRRQELSEPLLQCQTPCCAKVAPSESVSQTFISPYCRSNRSECFACVIPPTGPSWMTGSHYGAAFKDLSGSLPAEDTFISYFLWPNRF